MKEFVIYTVLVGSYDNITQPKVIDERFDYVLFSNDIKEPAIGVWTIRPIPMVIQNDNKRLSRYPKTHPESLLSEYKASLYIDANIQIMDQWVYDRYVELYNQKVEYAGIKLLETGCDCIYEHSFEMCQWLLEHDYNAIKQCHQLYVLGFPRHFGLNENNIIFRIHTDSMKKTDEDWWKWICNYSHRDQFSYMYCLWKNNIKINYFLPEGEDARTGNHFSLVNHTESGISKKSIRRGLFEKIRIKSKSFNHEANRKRWVQLLQSSHPVALLYMDGVWVTLKNIPKIVRFLFQEYFL